MILAAALTVALSQPPPDRAARRFFWAGAVADAASTYYTIERGQVETNRLLRGLHDDSAGAAAGTIVLTAGAEWIMRRTLRNKPKWRRAVYIVSGTYRFGLAARNVRRVRHR